MKNIFDLTPAELEQHLVSTGEPPYRCRQVLGWLYRGLVTSFEAMSDLPRPLRERLASSFSLTGIIPAAERVAKDGLTRKMLFRLADGRTVESGFMLYREASRRGTVCVSSQVGCPVGCPFCATGQQGFERNLTAGEIIEQVLHFCRSAKTSPVTNIVFMGMGEPLANYRTVMQSIQAFNTHLGIGIRQITVSTAGLVPAIGKLSGEKLRVELSVSLHAAEDSLRDRLVPLNRRYPLRELMAACRGYFAATGRRLTFEYALFHGVNDSPAQALQLAGLLRGLNCHVNLIAGNPTSGGEFAPSPAESVRAFRRALTDRGIAATVRLPRGADIEAGCGQLRSRLSGIDTP